MLFKRPSLCDGLSLIHYFSGDFHLRINPRIANIIGPKIFLILDFLSESNSLILWLFYLFIQIIQKNQMKKLIF